MQWVIIGVIDEWVPWPGSGIACIDHKAVRGPGPFNSLCPNDIICQRNGTLNNIGFRAIADDTLSITP